MDEQNDQLELIIDYAVDSVRSFGESVQEDLKLQLQSLNPLLAEFTASGNVEQLNVIGFRIRGWARQHKVRAVRESEQLLADIITMIISLGVKALA